MPNGPQVSIVSGASLKSVRGTADISRSHDIRSCEYHLTPDHFVRSGDDQSWQIFYYRYSSDAATASSFCF